MFLTCKISDHHKARLWIKKNFPSYRKRSFYVSTCDEYTVHACDKIWQDGSKTSFTFFPRDMKGEVVHEHQFFGGTTINDVKYNLNTCGSFIVGIDKYMHIHCNAATAEMCLGITAE